MIRFAGVDLLSDQRGTLKAFLESNGFDFGTLFAAPMAAHDGRNNPVCRHEPTAPFPTPNYPELPRLMINQLYWPTGAARWSQFIGIATREALTLILQTVAGYRVGWKPAQLVIGDGEFQGQPQADQVSTDGNGARVLSTRMFLLEPHPVSIPSGDAVDGVTTFWLLPLVDVRYWWQFRPVLQRNNGVAWSNATKETWAGWLEVLQASLDDRDDDQRDVTLEFQPDVDVTEWFFPDRTELDRTRANVAMTLDALAHSCGRRFVRRVDGSCLLIDPTRSGMTHTSNLPLATTTAGGPIIAPAGPTALTQLTALSSLTPAGQPFRRSALYPQFVDVTFRKLVEYEDPNPDVNDLPSVGVFLPDPYFRMRLQAGTGVRTLREDISEEPHGVTHFLPGTAVTFHTPSWVGLHLYHDGVSGDCPEPPGTIDQNFYGDRYMRFARAVAANYVAWREQQHDYHLIGMADWEMTGFDDCAVWCAETLTTHVRSLPPNFGVNTLLVQLHRQTDFDPDQVVGAIVSEWTLYPKELEAVEDPPPEDACSLLGASGPACEYPVQLQSGGIIEDFFPHSWQWAEAQVRPFIPSDPWAAEGSIQAGRTMVWLGAEITGVTRSQKIIQALRDEIGCDTLPAAGAPSDCPDEMTPDRTDCFDWDRTDVLTTAAGVSYLRRYGDEWQFIWIDCE